jgi:hypothetical protein
MIGSDILSYVDCWFNFILTLLRRFIGQIPIGLHCPLCQLCFSEGKVKFCAKPFQIRGVFPLPI